MGLIIGYHATIINNKPVLINNKGETGDIDWLLDDYAGKDYKKVAYDLDYFAAILFKSINMTEAEAKTLLAKGKLHLYLDNLAYDITYFPSKYLGISRGGGYGKPYAGIFNAEQYLTATHYELNPTLEDCVVKAKEAKTITSEASWTLYQLGLDPSTITSPVRSMEKSILANLDLPTHLDIPPEVNDLALNCCPGNWVESYKLGYFPETYDLDITSCYASMLAELYDTRRGIWLNSTVAPIEAVYGFAYGEVTITSSFSPVVIRKPEKLNYTPVGTWNAYLTLQEIEFIKKYKLGKFYIEDGWWWVSKGVQYQPLKGVVNHLHKKRDDANYLQNKILKRCLAGLWGRTLHTHYEQGKLVYGVAFNPVIGSLVETNTRLEVARMVLENGLYPDHLLHIAVDGILTNCPVKLSGGNGLGGWHLSHTGGAIVVNSGVAAVEGKAGAEDFAISYEWLMQAIKSKPDANEYVMNKVSPVTLAKAINTEFSKLGELEDITRAISVGTDGKRLYYEIPVTGSDLLNNQYDSEPLDIALIIGKGNETKTASSED